MEKEFRENGILCQIISNSFFPMQSTGKWDLRFKYGQITNTLKILYSINYSPTLLLKKNWNENNTVKPRLSGMHLSGNTLSGRFFSGTKIRNVILLHLAGNLCFRNRTVVLGTKPCFTMTKSPCYPDTRQSVIDLHVRLSGSINTASHKRAWLATRLLL